MATHLQYLETFQARNLSDKNTNKNTQASIFKYSG